MTRKSSSKRSEPAEFIDELADEALDRPASALALACHQTAMPAMVKT